MVFWRTPPDYDLFSQFSKYCLVHASEIHVVSAIFPNLFGVEDIGGYGMEGVGGGERC